ncbi:MAG: hypothetical protein ABFS23_06385 [Pseudomonadota bacterium]
MPEPTPERAAEYARQAPKSILELQQFQSISRSKGEDKEGRVGSARLVNLNPHINTWFVLSLGWDGQPVETEYHLENPDPRRQQVRLAEDFRQGLVIKTDDGQTRCDLWSGDSLEQARRTGLPFAPLCNARLFLRNPTTGRRSRLESLTEFLRDNVWGGEEIVGFVKRGFFEDAFLERGVPAGATHCPVPASRAPAPARVRDADQGIAVTPENLGIVLEETRGSMVLGCWYPVAGVPGIHLSTYQARSAPPDVFTRHRERLKALDSVEARALNYLVAFDLKAFDLHFELGTDHPRLGWSKRALPAVRDSRLAGPDGFDRAAPLVNTGMVAPRSAARTVATFTGGFKRQHSAFRYGALANRNRGSHYGFISHGVVFSKPQPGLSTLLVLKDGSVRIKTWAETDNELLGVIRHARQNGVPIVRADPETGDAVPGELVSRWGPGNWSGSAEGKLRTLRAGACIQETSQGRFLIYGYFSSATPSAMARVFGAYGCDEAIHLDMNALEHSYLAVYSRHQDRMSVQHLITGMEVLDKESRGELVPRFLGFPDNRDFFYLVRRAARP